MHRASEKIGAFAGSFAKAQAELANPERTLIATVVDGRGGESEFRYASLAQGLDIVRKCLGRNEIAVTQTTAVEHGQIILTTLLVHASGEWVSSCWPVCSSTESSARAKGAALTYARRYALFTMVGIAGEDDLDAPDPAIPVTHVVTPSSEDATRRKPTPQVATAGRELPPAASSDLGLRLRSELEGINDADALAPWIQRVMPLKNGLLGVDADQLKAAFLTKLAQLGQHTVDQPPVGSSPDKHPIADGDSDGAVSPEAVVTIRKPVRERDKHHLRFVSAQSCLGSGLIKSTKRGRLQDRRMPDSCERAYRSELQCV